MIDSVLIYEYKRSQAIADGLLIDCTKEARECGFKYPLALTKAVWDEYVVMPEGVRFQNQEGRLWDIVWMASCVVTGMIREAYKETSRIGNYERKAYDFFCRNDNEEEPKMVRLVIMVHPGDDMEPVITIHKPGED